MFADRKHAGEFLAKSLTSYVSSNGLVLGLARGGVVVAARVASALNLPLDVLGIKKLASPFDPELAVGAVGPDGVMAVDWPLAQRAGADEHFIQSQISNLNDHIKERERTYRKGKKPLTVKGKTVILVDDGAATGLTMDAAITWCKKKGAAKIVCALPVAARDTVKKLKPEVDELIVLETPDDFESVGKWYQQFTQVSDEEVVELLGERNPKHKAQNSK